MQVFALWVCKFQVAKVTTASETSSVAKKAAVKVKSSTNLVILEKREQPDVIVGETRTTKGDSVLAVAIIRSTAACIMATGSYLHAMSTCERDVSKHF